MRIKQKMIVVLGTTAGILGIGLAAWAQNLSVAGQVTASGTLCPTGGCVHSFVGKVGIGTASPGYALDVAGDIRANAGWLRTGAAGVGVYFENAGLGMNATHGSYGTLAAYGAKNGYYGMQFGPSVGSPNWMFDGAGNGGLFYEGVIWAMYWNAPGQALGVGHTPNTSYMLDVNGYVLSYGYYNASSRDFKQNINYVKPTQYQKMLAAVNEMKLATYYYKKEYKGDGTKKIGFIAEEMPNEVRGKDGKSVDVYELVTYSIGAMKAQQEQIQELRAELQAIKANVK